jgi:hypothetical protein
MSAGSAVDDRPEPVTTATSMSPWCRRSQASYIAHAPSISTCESRLGGHAPMASRLLTNENVAPEM